MTPSGRIAAAIDILADLFARSRPAAMALKDWGQSHRFAGSKDRAAIASLVYDALRRKASSAWIMGEETPRGVMLGALHLARGLDADAIAALFSGEKFAPLPLTDNERSRLASASLDGAPAHVAGDFPEWLQPSLERAFGDDLVPEMQALAQRAPLDIRVNRLKARRDQVQAELAHFGAEETPWSPDGLRMQVGEDGRGPSVQVEPAFLKGWFEVQDEGSQLVALMSDVKPGEQVVDLCAGAGGKTLALAAMMENRGQIFATDVDARRLAPLHDRLARCGAHNVQVRTPKGRWTPDGPDPLDDLAGRIDCVFVDAPCTGVGTWRRNPDAKWRLRPGALAERVRDQAVVLDRAARLVKPGGRIIYVTCSLLPEENDEALEAFRQRSVAISFMLSADISYPARNTSFGLQLTPNATRTDGFFIAKALKK